MLIPLIVGILLGGAAVFFFIQNVAVVTVTAFAWQFTAPLAAILALCALFGAMIALLLTLPTAIREDWNNAKLRQSLRDLEARLSERERAPAATPAPAVPDYSSATKTA